MSPQPFKPMLSQACGISPLCAENPAVRPRPPTVVGEWRRPRTKGERPRTDLSCLPQPVFAKRALHGRERRTGSLDGQVANKGEKYAGIVLTNFCTGLN